MSKLMEVYGQLGFKPDIEGLIKLFEDKSYIRRGAITVYNGDDVLIDCNREHLVAECAIGFNQEKRLILKEIKTVDYQQRLMDIAIDKISECISLQREMGIDYLFVYNDMTYSFHVIYYSKNFQPKTIIDETGKTITSISTQDLLKFWGNYGYKEMTPQELYNIFTVKGTHCSEVDIRVADQCLRHNGKLDDASMLLRNNIKNVYLRHEINEDGSENIVIHKGKVKGVGGYNSKFVISVPCNKISGCIYNGLTSRSLCKDDKLFKKDLSTIQIAFGNIVCLLELNGIWCND